MTLPPSFTTQSLGDLKLVEGTASYRPTNQNEHRFLFEPHQNPNPTAWITLIDQRAPQLNSQWPAILASSPDKLKSALSAIGQPSLSEDAGLQHITLNGEGEAILLVSLFKSEESHSLEASLDEQGLVKDINATR
ncbi:MAG: hypothetical protein ACSHYB_14485 [Roseibacillus sp.]